MSVDPDQEHEKILDELLIAGTPLLDVRAPIEFLKGHIPNSTNLPVLEDEERHRVGICYKEKGPDAAEALGHVLVSGARRATLIDRWQQFLGEHPEAWVCCFRGGKRSEVSAQWLAEAGVPTNRVPGGYKALRRRLLGVYESLPSLVLVSGPTGSGKTAVLGLVPASIDLEDAANHRGSAFGGFLTAQPDQATFENKVAADILRFKHANPNDALFVEDESRLIGRRNLPVPLQAAMAEAPVVVVEVSLAERVQRIYDEYVVSQWAEYSSRLGASASGAFREYLLGALDAIRKRLGGERHKKFRQQMEGALASGEPGDASLHRVWIESLLRDYYDPMYHYQLEKKSHRIVFRGSREAIGAWSHSEQGGHVGG